MKLVLFLLLISRKIMDLREVLFIQKKIIFIDKIIVDVFTVRIFHERIENKKMNYGKNMMKLLRDS